MEQVAERPPFISTINSRLTLIDTTSGQVLLDTVIDECTMPHSSWIVGQHAYVTCEPQEQIAVLNLTTGQTIDRINTLQKGAHVLGFDTASGTLAISNTNTSSVTLVEIDSRDTQVVDLPAGSEGLSVIGDRIWVANAFDKSLSVVDPVKARVVEEVESVCDFPIAISHRTKSSIWVACFGSAELVEIDPERSVIGRRIKLSDQPLNVLIHPQQALAYVSYPRKNAIGEIDLESGNEIRRIGVGIEPDGLRWATQPDQTYP